LVVGLIALLMAGGLVLAGCGVVGPCLTPCVKDSSGSKNCTRGTCAVTKSVNSGGGIATCDCS